MDTSDLTSKGAVAVNAMIESTVGKMLCSFPILSNDSLKVQPLYKQDLTQKINHAIL